jgi:phosphoglycolate phosphatase-like HAD superfamily hydrolase
VKALALDFDGVLSNSAREAFAVALRTFAALRPRAALARAAAGAGAQPALFAGFLALMPLGNRAEDYGVALAALESGVVLPDQAAYDAWYAAQDGAWLRAFHARFYEVRTEWARRDREGWLRLMPPFAPFLEVLRRRAGEATYAIVTAKDRASVEELLASYGAADLFARERILDKQAGRSKRAHLGRLAADLALPWAEVTFVDDKLNHLAEAAALGVRCALAGWGYNGPREHAAAAAAGLPVLTLESAERALFGPPRAAAASTRRAAC